MELELHSTYSGPIVDGYGENYITISGKRVKNTFLLFPDKLHEIKISFSFIYCKLLTIKRKIIIYSFTIII